MKRIIREVITLVRIERWLVKESSPSSPASGEEAAIEHLIEESTLHSHDTDGDDLRVIAQRVLDAQQWEIAPDGTFLNKRSVNAEQTPKEVE